MVLDSLTHLATLIHSLTHLRHSLHTAHDEMTSSSTFELAVETVEHLRLKLPATLARPRVAIVCGSGLGGLAGTVNGRNKDEGGREEEYVEWAYKDVPNFPVSTGRYTWTLRRANRRWEMEQSLKGLGVKQEGPWLMCMV